MLAHLSLFPFSFYLSKSPLDLLLFILGDNASLLQCFRKGDGTLDIGRIHALVVGERLVVLVHPATTENDKTGCPCRMIVRLETYRGSVAPVNRPLRTIDETGQSEGGRRLRFQGFPLTPIAFAL